MRKTVSGGGVVINSEGQVLVVSQHGNSWSLPKGHIDPGEDVRAAAEREVKEESGISNLEYVRDLGKYERYMIGKNGGEDTTEWKLIIIFLYTTDQQELLPEDPDNPEARWVNPDEVVDLLTHPKDKEFFQSKLGEIKQFIDNSLPATILD
jgi:ADP-ribose pyrophosphatase YjhB (NUDIX family)